jgi:hypothetical protein
MVFPQAHQIYITQEDLQASFLTVNGNPSLSIAAGTESKP